MIQAIAQEYMSRGWTLQNGGGYLDEEYIPGPGGGTDGSAYPDITLTQNGTTLRINTVDLDSNGNIDFREMVNAEKITYAFPSDALILIPKWWQQ